jgi:hypothetical protein
MGRSWQAETAQNSVRQVAFSGFPGILQNAGKGKAESVGWEGSIFLSKVQYFSIYETQKEEFIPCSPDKRKARAREMASRVLRYPPQRCLSALLGYKYYDIIENLGLNGALLARGRGG